MNLVLTEAPGDPEASCLVDSHVHIHACFDTARFFDGAWSNFEAGAADLGLRIGTLGVLCLTENTGVGVFRDLQRRVSGAPIGAWSFHETLEEDSLVARRADGAQLVLIAGRQIVTQERLEVLAIGWPREHQDGDPLQVVLAKLSEQNAIAVVPWAFGKWWFRRGQLVWDLVHATAPPRFFLGDSAGRWRRSPPPRVFASAIARKTFVLNGSDPLPFASHTGRAGRFGFVLHWNIGTARPSAALKEVVWSLAGQPRSFGARTGLRQLVRDQLCMQYTKHCRHGLSPGRGNRFPT